MLVFCLCGMAWAHDVKDPVCRMTTDTDTTPYREVIGGKTFYFCSAACQAKFDTNPAAYVALADELRKAGRREYHFDLTAPPHLQAGHPVPLTFAIRYADTNKLVPQFEIVHQKLIHLILVSADLSWFEHQHPTRSADGLFRLAWTFPHPGRYYLFGDFTPYDGDNQIKRVTLNVGRQPQAPPKPTMLKLDASETKVVDGIQIRLALRPLPLRVAQQNLLTYTLTDRLGHPITDMQPILGTMGHLIAITADAETMVHTHPLHGVAPGSYAAAMLAVMQTAQVEKQIVTPEMVSLTGPTFTFKLTPPKPGRYKVWAQFQRKNQWLTVPFTVEAR